MSFRGNRWDAPPPIWQRPQPWGFPFQVVQPPFNNHGWLNHNHAPGVATNTRSPTPPPPGTEDGAHCGPSSRNEPRKDSRNDTYEKGHRRDRSSDRYSSGSWNNRGGPSERWRNHPNQRSPFWPPQNGRRGGSYSRGRYRRDRPPEDAHLVLSSNNEWIDFTMDQNINETWSEKETQSSKTEPEKTQIILGSDEERQKNIQDKLKWLKNKMKNKDVSEEEKFLSEKTKQKAAVPSTSTQKDTDKNLYCLSTTDNSALEETSVEKVKEKLASALPDDTNLSSPLLNENMTQDRRRTARLKRSPLVQARPRNPFQKCSASPSRTATGYTNRKAEIIFGRKPIQRGAPRKSSNVVSANTTSNDIAPRNTTTVPSYNPDQQDKEYNLTCTTTSTRKPSTQPVGVKRKNLWECVSKLCGVSNLGQLKYLLDNPKPGKFEYYLKEQIRKHRLMSCRVVRLSGDPLTETGTQQIDSQVKTENRTKEDVISSLENWDCSVDMTDLPFEFVQELGKMLELDFPSPNEWVEQIPIPVQENTPTLIIEDSPTSAELLPSSPPTKTPATYVPPSTCKPGIRIKDFARFVESKPVPPQGENDAAKSKNGATREADTTINAPHPLDGPNLMAAVTATSAIAPSVTVQAVAARIPSNSATSSNNPPRNNTSITVQAASIPSNSTTPSNNPPRNNIAPSVTVQAANTHSNSPTPPNNPPRNNIAPSVTVQSASTPSNSPTPSNNPPRNNIAPSVTVQSASTPSNSPTPSNNPPRNNIAPSVTVQSASTPSNSATSSNNPLPNNMGIRLPYVSIRRLNILPQDVFYSAENSGKKSKKSGKSPSRPKPSEIVRPVISPTKVPSKHGRRKSPDSTVPVPVPVPHCAEQAGKGQVNPPEKPQEEKDKDRRKTSAKKKSTPADSSFREASEEESSSSKSLTEPRILARLQEIYREISSLNAKVATLENERENLYTLLPLAKENFKRKKRCSESTDDESVRQKIMADVYADLLSAPKLSDQQVSPSVENRPTKKRKFAKKRSSGSSSFEKHVEPRSQISVPIPRSSGSSSLEKHIGPRSQISVPAPVPVSVPKPPQPKAIKLVKGTLAFYNHNLTFACEKNMLPKDCGIITQIKVIRKSVLAASEDGNIYSFSSTNGKYRRAFEGGRSPVKSFVLGEINSKPLLIFGSEDGHLFCYALTSGERINKLHVTNEIQCLETRWGSVYIGTKCGSILKYDIATNTQNSDPFLSDNGEIFGIRCTTEGPRRVILVASKTYGIQLWAARDGMLLRDIVADWDGSVLPRGSPDLKFAVDVNIDKVCFSKLGQIFIAEFSNTEVNAPFKVSISTHVSCMCIYKATLYVGCKDGSIRRFNLKTYEELEPLTGNRENVVCMDVIDEKIILARKGGVFDVACLKKSNEGTDADEE